MRKLAEIAGIAAKKKGGCRFPLPSSESGLLPVNAPVRQPAVVLPCHPEHLRHHLWGLPVGREPLRHRPAGRLCRGVDVLRAGPAVAAEDDPRQTPGGGREVARGQFRNNARLGGTPIKLTQSSMVLF